MHTKQRNGRVMLYRSNYVRKGANNNSHGYAVQEFVGSLPADAQEVTAELVKKLSPEELEYVEDRVLKPARLAAQEARRAEEAHQKDPGWRLDEALRLLNDAGRLVADAGLCLDVEKLSALTAALDRVISSAIPRLDPLDAALAAVVEATMAVKGGCYGNAPADNVRDTPVYKRWRRVGEAVDSGTDSLLKALQGKGWARVRG